MQASAEGVHGKERDCAESQAGTVRKTYRRESARRRGKNIKGNITSKKPNDGGGKGLIANAENGRHPWAPLS